MADQLSEGAIMTILTGGEVLNPVLQVLGHRKLVGKGNSDRYRILISDGVYCNSFAMLATQLNHMVESDQLPEFSIVRVTRHLTSLVNNHNNEGQKRVIILLDITVLKHGSEVGFKIGNPEAIDGTRNNLMSGRTEPPVMSTQPLPQPQYRPSQPTTNVQPSCAAKTDSLDLPSRESQLSPSPGTSHQLLQPFIQRTLKSFTEARHCKITQSLLYFICKDYMPLSVVDGLGFKQLMKETVPLYKVPSRNTMKSLINKKYDTLSFHFKNIIVKTDYFSITADCWSEMMNTSSFLGITAHFVDGTSLESIALGVVPLDKSHTADYLGQQLISNLAEWNIPSSKVCSIVTDNENTIVKAASDMFGEEKHIRCLAHSLNLLSEKAINNTEGLPDLLKKVREIVKFFKRSVLSSDQLRDEQKKRGRNEGEILKLKLDVPTRWNSKFFMVSRFLELSNIVNNVLLACPEAPPMLSPIELENLQEVQGILSFLEQLTREISGDQYVTASMKIPLLNSLLQSINSTVPKLPIGNKLKESIQKEFGIRFKDFEHDMLAAIPMMLDPRFKNIHFSDHVAASKMLSQLEKLVNNLEADKGTQGSSSSESESGSTTPDIWAHHRSLAMKSNQRMVETDPDHDYSINTSSEINLYFATPVYNNHKAKPLELWEDLKTMYPKLYILARKYLVSVSTSVPSERLFSKAGATITERRNRLSGKLLSKIIFLNGLPDKYWR